MKNLARTTRCLLATTALSLSSALATPEMVPQDDIGLSDFIQMSYSADDRLAEEKIRVSVEQGIARVSGKVATLDQAERIVKRTLATDGVSAVISDVSVARSGKSDAALSAEASRRIANSPALDSSRITVTVRSGIASLSGETGNWDQQETARELVSEVVGISAIDNRIDATSETAAVSDAALRSQIQHRIADEPLFDGLPLELSVSGGKVSLSGEVGTRGEKDLLARVASISGVNSISVRGVTIVRSLSMEGMTGKTPGPGAIGNTVAVAFRSDERLRGENISARVDGRILHLGGSVSSFDARYAAEATARGVAGVDVVINRIAVGADRRVAVASPN